MSVDIWPRFRQAADTFSLPYTTFKRTCRPGTSSRSSIRRCKARQPGFERARRPPSLRHGVPRECRRSVRASGLRSCARLGAPQGWPCETQKGANGHLTPHAPFPTLPLFRLAGGIRFEGDSGRRRVARCLFWARPAGLSAGGKAPARWCNGSTRPFGGQSLGSNPSRATKGRWRERNRQKREDSGRKCASGSG